MTTTRKPAHPRNRARQASGHPGRREWREAPATVAQVEALRTMAMESGRTFTLDVTRGEAWRRIREATTLLDARRRLACAPPWYRAPTVRAVR